MSIKENEEIPVCQRNGNVHNYYDSKTAEKNSLLRAKLFKEVRKPGRDFSGVFSHLNNFNVGMPTKLFMVREMIHEAGRKSLIKLLEDFERTLLASYNISSPFSRNSSFIPQLSHTR
ncbi:integrator complex subunit 6-like [Tachypleus tridentatus]|uniref:integrator complex subunit 6-like n=1 Tax=Tachypleus tridentatus TaxID=6853 RepID=UPI003FCF60E1